jgi:hypothetical protein
LTLTKNIKISNPKVKIHFGFAIKTKTPITLKWIFQIKTFPYCKDHSVSKEIFDLYHDETTDMLITYPQPSLDNLGKYYESEDYISHTDGKRSLFEKAYHFIKALP